MLQLTMGVWQRLGERPATGDPFSGPPGPDSVAFETRVSEPFDGYRGRVIIRWGEGERAWVQRADLQQKDVLVVREKAEDPPFPGFIKLHHRLDQIATLPISWAEVLRHARGVYLLVHRASGQQYVGSAYGEGGFLARWLAYADGHGGNVALRELGAPAEAYDVAVLEVTGTDADIHVLEREAAWKRKLGTRTKGLNRN
jgi:hypothetical protein